MGIIVAAFVIGALSVALWLGQSLETDRLRLVTRRLRLRQFSLGQMMAAIVVAALLFHVFTARGPDGLYSFVLLCLAFLIWLVRNWQNEFVFLMGLKDGDFPGRHDKVIWAAVLLAFAPIGVWFFRAYRLAHWPEPAPSIDGERGTATQPA